MEDQQQPPPPEESPHPAPAPAPAPAPPPPPPRPRPHRIANANANAIHSLPLRYLLIPPLLLALLTLLFLFYASDVNVALLYSQCHARSRLPWLSSGIPLLGAPLCFLVSFFQEALASVRAAATMAPILSFVAALLTVSTVEAARLCNGPSVLIAYPTGAWLVFNLVGGAVVWELVIIPAFFHRAKQIYAAEEEEVEARGEESAVVAGGRGDRAAAAAGASVEDGGERGHGGGHPGRNGDVAAAAVAASVPAAVAAERATSRHLKVSAEAVAIPVAVALGCVLPSAVMLALDSPAAVLIWLFFPLYVSLLRQGVRKLLLLLSSPGSGRGGLHAPLHLESHRPSLVAVYALPVACSALAHGFFLADLLLAPDDRREMTRSTLAFVEVDFFFVALTVLYWLLVEAGGRVVLLMLAASLLLGPGAGLCVGWYLRERQLGFAYEAEEEDDEEEEDGGEEGEEGVALGEEEHEGGREGGREGEGEGGAAVGEETPLLR